MKILHVIATFPPAYAFGGPPVVAFSICRKLAEMGHYVEVYTTNAYDQKFNFRFRNMSVVIRDIKVTYFNNILRPNNLYIALGMISEMRKNLENFDVVHVHFGRQLYDIYIGLIAPKLGVPYVVQAHGCLPKIGKRKMLKSIFDTFFGKKILMKSAKAIALSKVEAEQYRSMGVPEEKIAIIPNGIDLSEYAELPPKGSFKKKFNISEDKKIILYLGRIHRMKGLDFLVKAYAYLIKSMNYRNAVLVIAGPDDGYLTKIRSVVQNLGISNSVLFTGLISEKYKIRAYVDADVVVNVEPFNIYGLVPLEAAACSTPVIVSKTNAISEIVNAGKFGYSVEYGDIVSLAATLRNILDDEELADNLGKNGRGYIFRNFGWNKIVEKYEQVYEEVVGG
ncbi:MAG: glycosyltransferase [Candidatus Baldrarchaeia archaeon]